MTSTLTAEETLEIRTLSDVIVAQRRARFLAASLGSTRQAQWEIATAVSEAATNIIKFPERGRLCLRAVQAELPYFEFEAIDHGGGIQNVDRAIQDGISEGQDLVQLEPVARHGLGVGLGAIRRLMDRLEVISSTQGTVVRARKDLRPGTR